MTRRSKNPLGKPYPVAVPNHADVCVTIDLTDYAKKNPTKPQTLKYYFINSITKKPVRKNTKLTVEQIAEVRKIAASEIHKIYVIGETAQSTRINGLTFALGSEQYFSHVEEKKSARTLQTYKETLKLFIEKNGHLNVNTMTLADLRTILFNFVSWMKEAKNATGKKAGQPRFNKTSLYHFRSTMQTFTKWLEIWPQCPFQAIKGQNVINSKLNIERHKGSRKDKILPKGLVSKALSLLEGTAELMPALLCLHGIRISCAANLTYGDFDAYTNTFNTEQKGETVNPVVMPSLARYIKEMLGRGLAKPSDKLYPKAQKTAEGILCDLRAVHDLPATVTFGSFRKSSQKLVALEMFEIIRAQFGHENETTNQEHYYGEKDFSADTLGVVLESLFGPYLQTILQNALNWGDAQKVKSSNENPLQA